MLLPVAIIFSASILLLRCQHPIERTALPNLDALKTKYSVDVINYFYEVVFYQDYVSPTNFLYKWKDNIWISMEGELWPEDSLYVNNAITQLNALEIPIKLQITRDTLKANLRMYFGSFTYLEEKLDIKSYPMFRGYGHISYDSFTIKSGHIGIANNSSVYSRIQTKSDTLMIRKSIILQELAQTLGVVGDSWLRHKSSFFEGVNKAPCLSEIDKKVLRLLYEPSVPSGYSRKNFEHDFAEILFNINAKSKLLAYVKRNKVPLPYLQYICDYSFTNGVLIKYPRKIFVKIQGDYNKFDSLFCMRVIERFNEASEYLSLQISANDIYSNPSLNIEFIKKQRGPVAVELSVVNTHQMLKRRVVGNINISYPGNLSRDNHEKRNKLLIKSVYKILGFDLLEEEVAAIDSLNISFKSNFREMLSLMYDPVIPDGFSKDDMQDVIEKLKQ